MIYECNVKNGRTLRESQELGYRPPIHLKSQVIVPNGVEAFEIDEDSDIMEEVIRPSGLSASEKGIKLW